MAPFPRSWLPTDAEDQQLVSSPRKINCALRQKTGLTQVAVTLHRLQRV